MPTLYPTAADLTAALSGLPTIDAARAATATLAGIRQFEKDCGDRHFLANKDIANAALSPTPRTFDPPFNGFVMVPDLSAGPPAPLIEYAPTGSTAQTYVRNTDYILEPRNAAEEGLPYRTVQFLKRWYGPIPWSLAGAIRITALWGYGTVLPDDAWLAMITAGMVNYLGIGRLTAGGFFPLKAWSAPGGVSQTYETSFGQAEIAAYMAAVRNYKRLEI